MLYQLRDPTWFGSVTHLTVYTSPPQTFDSFVGSPSSLFLGTVYHMTLIPQCRHLIPSKSQRSFERDLAKTVM
uniref:Uncharacterized protein n=1 Tax=Arundo donax TaxID=35708 RepID=A0A0A9AJF5_ARUDO